MPFAEIVALGHEPSAITLEPFVVAYLEEHGPTETIDLANAIEAAWLAAAGEPLQADPRPVLKRVLDHLAVRGSVVQEGVFGAWRLGRPGDETPPEVDGLDAVAGGLSEAEVDAVGETLVEEDPDRIELGSGDQFVYCFYLPAYRREAEASGQARWPIKVGMATGSLTTQIAAQTTGLPEHPVVAVVLRTHDAGLLEMAIRIVLSYRGRWIREAGGSEWYRTSPDEIVDIFAFVRADQPRPPWDRALRSRRAAAGRVSCRPLAARPAQ